MIRLLPASAEGRYKGVKLASTAFLLLTIAGIVRSLIHMFAEDGGAGSIAGIDLEVGGRDTIVGMFAMWGSSQFLLALMQLIVYVRYRSLIPLLYVLLWLEQVLRLGMGWLRPIGAQDAPGEIASYVLIPLLIVLWNLSLPILSTKESEV